MQVEDYFTQPQLHKRSGLSLYISTSSLAFAARPFERRKFASSVARESKAKRSFTHREREDNNCLFFFSFVFYLS